MSAGILSFSREWANHAYSQPRQSQIAQMNKVFLKKLKTDFTILMGRIIEGFVKLKKGALRVKIFCELIYWPTNIHVVCRAIYWK